MIAFSRPRAGKGEGARNLYASLCVIEREGDK